jgi:MinD superfamily P-loop ATPase
VEEPNAHIFLKPEFTKEEEVFLPIPEILEEQCTYCGKCGEVCAFNAIAVVKDTVLVFPELCHGCGGCSLLCPEHAIEEKGQRIGVMEFGTVDRIRFIHGRLDIGQAISPPLIREIKKHINPSSTVIIDAPPGTSCAMVGAVKGSDVALLVTEPTPFGLNDLKIAAETVRGLAIPFGVVINRYGTGDSGVEEYCRQENIPILMTIPMDKKIAVAYSEGKTIIETQPDYKTKFVELYEKTKDLQG